MSIKVILIISFFCAELVTLILAASIPPEVVTLTIGTTLSEFHKRFPQAHYDNSTNMFYLDINNKFVEEVEFDFRNFMDKRSENIYLFGLIQPKLLAIRLRADDRMTPQLTSQDIFEFVSECKSLWGDPHEVFLRSNKIYHYYFHYVVYFWKVGEKNVYLSFLPLKIIEKMKKSKKVRSYPTPFYISITSKSQKDEFPSSFIRQITDNERKEYSID